MAYTAADLDNLKRVIASGESRVRFSDGREIQYQSSADLKAVQADIENELSRGTAKPVVRQIRIFTNKGF